MTHDKVRQDFEANPAFKYMDFALDKDAWGREKYKHSHIQALFDGYQAGRAAERAEIREKLESDGVVEAVKQSVVLGEDEIGCDVYLNDIEAKQVIAAITKVLEVI